MAACRSAETDSLDQRLRHGVMLQHSNGLHSHGTTARSGDREFIRKLFRHNVGNKIQQHHRQRRGQGDAIRVKDFDLQHDTSSFVRSFFFFYLHRTTD